MRLSLGLSTKPPGKPHVFCSGLKSSLADRLLSLLMAKVLQKKVIHTWDTPIELHSDWGAHFTNKKF